MFQEEFWCHHQPLGKGLWIQSQETPPPSSLAKRHYPREKALLINEELNFLVIILGAKLLFVFASWGQKFHSKEFGLRYK
jgi:hypothetical protein